MMLWWVIVEIGVAVVSCSNNDVELTAAPAAAITAAGLNNVFLFGDSKSSSSSSIGLFGVIATVSLKHKHAQ